MPGWFGRRRTPAPPDPVADERTVQGRPMTGRRGEGLGLELLADPWQVAAALAADPRGPAQWWVRDGRLGYTYDPDMSAHRDDDGGWVVEYVERGVARPGPRLPDDRAMVTWMLGEARGT
jgi:hypothetical protein